MASKLNSEFNYRYQVIGDTPWERIKTLKGFLEGRIRAAALQEVGKLKEQATLAELRYLEAEGNGLEHEILRLKANIMEAETGKAIAEPTRIKDYTDEEMFEANAANEFTVNIGREIQAEMIANGRPSPAKLRNAMSNPHTWNALKGIGLIPRETKILEGNINPNEKIKLIGVEDEII